MAAGSGLVLGGLVFFASGTVSASGYLPGVVKDIANGIDAYVPVPHACRLVLTIAASVALAFFFNFALWLLFGRGDRRIGKRVYNKLTDLLGNSLSQLLRKAADRQKLVILTLKSRKVYCGRILEVPPNIEREDACIEILPSFSGYRDKDTLRMGRERTDYPVIALWEARRYLSSRQSVLEEFDALVNKIGREGFDSFEQLSVIRRQLLSEIAEAKATIGSVGSAENFDPNDWIKVIPIKEIESASFYDPDAYKEWFGAVEGGYGFSEEIAGPGEATR